MWTHQTCNCALRLGPPTETVIHKPAPLRYNFARLLQFPRMSLNCLLAHNIEQVTRNSRPAKDCVTIYMYDKQLHLHQV
jgi:hypothetical protein